MTTYPADLIPAVLCWGQKQMSAAYSGPALDVLNPSTGVSTTINFASSGALDTASLDAALNGQTGIVTRWYGQKNAINLDQMPGQGPSIATIIAGNSRAIIFQGESQSGALFGMQTIADISSLGITAKDYSVVAVMQPSSSMYMNQALGLDAGALFDMVSAAPIVLNGTVTFGSAVVTGLSSTTALQVGDIVGAGGVGIAANSSIAAINSATQITLTTNALSDVTAATLMVARPGAERFTISGNLTAGSPLVTGIASTASCRAGDQIDSVGITITPGTKILTIDGATQVTLTVGANTSGTTPLTFVRPVARAYNNSVLGNRGAWEVSDGTFDFISPLSWVQINPSVIGITSDSSGVKLWQDGQIRATASRSALTRTAAYLYLGRLANSGTGGFGQGWGGSVVALMVYNVGLTEAQYASVASSLGQLYAIDFTVATNATNYVTLFGDSIPAGYKTLGIYGYDDYLLLGANHPARFANFAMPGSTVTQNPAGGPAYANTLGLFPTAGMPFLSAPNATKGRIVIFHAGGNDSGFGPAARTGATHGTTTIDSIADTSDLSIGDYVYASNLPTLTTITGKSATSITISNATTSSATVTLLFTYAATSPTAVYNALQSLVTQAVNAGATLVIVATILPRNVTYQPWLSALNVQIKSGITGATIVDVASYSNSQGSLAMNPGPAYADASHLSALGHQLMAAALQSTVNAGLS